MQLIFANDSLPTEVTSTIFLAGPNPRYKEGDKIEHTWRHQVIKELEKQNYQGHVFIPMDIDHFYGDVIEKSFENYDHQIEWEDAAMGRADVILMWVARSEHLPGLTTNIEFGRYLESGRLVYGRPPNTPNTQYLDEQTLKRRREPYSTIPAIVTETLWRIGKGSLRFRGEVLVPLMIWDSVQFQLWYRNMFSGDNALNELRGFDVKTVLCFNSRRSKVTDEKSIFGFAAHVNIWVDAEQREKSNEWVFSRTPTSYVIPFWMDKLGQPHYVIVREFRSPANNSQGMVYEFPGGSSPREDEDPAKTAAEELREEVGIEVTDLSRFQPLRKLQAMATYSISTIEAMAIQLSDEEFAKIKYMEKTNKQLGANEGEIIHLRTATYTELLRPDSKYPLDWSMIGLLALTNGSYF